MNIFVTSPDPRACAQALDDLRLNKMIVESCQILCTVLHLSGRGSPELYKSAYIRHPVVLWTARDARHYAWLVHHLEALFDERAFRFNSSEHRSLRLLPFLTQYVENLAVPDAFENCTSYKDVPSVYLAYQMTLKDKWLQDRRSPTWSNRGPSDFFCAPSDDHLAMLPRGPVASSS